MTESSVTVTVDSKLSPVFAAVGALVGLGAALLIGPVVSWLLERIETAPGLLRLIDQLPLIAAAPLLMVAGAAGGWLVFALWNEEVGRVVIDRQEVRIESKETSAVYAQDEIAEAFLDKDELVLIGDRLRELSRTTSDAGLAAKLSEAFSAFGYTWAGSQDPRDDAFQDWSDRSRDLAADTHELLRARRRALADEKSGEAEALRDDLAQRGVVVRDRDKRQQYRLIPEP